MTQTDPHPHTSQAMRHVALSLFLHVPESTVKPWRESPHLFSHAGDSYAVNDKTMHLVTCPLVGQSMGHNIYKLP